MISRSLLLLICRVNKTAFAATNNTIESAEHYSTKRQLLPLVATNYPSTVVGAHFPTITNFNSKL